MEQTEERMSDPEERNLEMTQEREEREEFSKNYLSFLYTI